jgi:hypothetical protein
MCGMAQILWFVKRFPFWTAVGVFAVVGFIFRDYFSGSVNDLRLGDCFDRPSNLSATVKDVQHHPCSDMHHAEVFFVGNLASDSGSAYPADATLNSFIENQCVPAYRTYTGRDFDSDKTYDIYYFSPTEDGWKKGDHTIDCFLTRADGQSFQGSVRVAH